MTNAAIIGSISTGTLRSEDLIRAFSGVLQHLANPTDRSEMQLLKDCAEFLDGAADHDEAGIIEDLFEALNKHAPQGCYFGSLEGDGADFGFHPLAEQDVA